MRTSVHLRQRADGGSLVEFIYLGRRWFAKSGETTSQWLISKSEFPNVWTPIRNAFTGVDMFKTGARFSKGDTADYDVKWEEMLYHVKLQLSRDRYGIPVPTLLR